MIGLSLSNRKKAANGKKLLMVDQLVMVDQATGTPEPRASIYLYLSIYLSIFSTRRWPLLTLPEHTSVVRTDVPFVFGTVWFFNKLQTQKENSQRPWPELVKTPVPSKFKGNKRYTRRPVKYIASC